MIGVLAAFFVSLTVTWLLTPEIVKLAVRCGAVAVPRDRDVHVTPTARWGGIAIMAGVVTATVITITARQYLNHGAYGWSKPVAGVLVAGVFIGLIGLIDDLKDIRAIWQATAIIAAAGILIAFGVRIEGLTNPFIAHKPGIYSPAQWIELAAPVSILLTVFWVFVVTKTVDAIDGLDGLAAGVCAISAATLALMSAYSRQSDGPALALLAASVVGACIGFLRYNYNPAKIFMSTVGAQFLGLTLAALSIQGTFKIAAAISVLVPVLVLGVPIFDYGIVLMKRLHHGAPLTAADNRHLHHRLLDRGLSKNQAVWVIYGVTTLFCAAAVIIFRVTR